MKRGRLPGHKLRTTGRPVNASASGQPLRGFSYLTSSWASKISMLCRFSSREGSRLLSASSRRQCSMFGNPPWTPPSGTPNRPHHASGAALCTSYIAHQRRLILARPVHPGPRISRMHLKPVHEVQISKQRAATGLGVNFRYGAIASLSGRPPRKAAVHTQTGFSRSTMNELKTVQFPKRQCFEKNSLRCSKLHRQECRSWSIIEGSYSPGGTVDRFIHQKNLEHFRRLLAEPDAAKDRERHKMLLNQGQKQPLDVRRRRLPDA
jgi:hypothetical protein